MRFEHNLPVLVQLRWLPVGGPYAAFNLPVRFSPMSIGAGGWVAQMVREPGLGWAPTAARRPGSPRRRGPPAGPRGRPWRWAERPGGTGRWQLPLCLAMARGSLSGRPSP